MWRLSKAFTTKLVISTRLTRLDSKMCARLRAAKLNEICCLFLALSTSFSGSFPRSSQQASDGKIIYFHFVIVRGWVDHVNKILLSLVAVAYLYHLHFYSLNSLHRTKSVSLIIQKFRRAPLKIANKYKHKWIIQRIKCDYSQEKRRARGQQRWNDIKWASDSWYFLFIINLQLPL